MTIACRGYVAQTLFKLSHAIDVGQIIMQRPPCTITSTHQFYHFVSRQRINSFSSYQRNSNNNNPINATRSQDNGDLLPPENDLEFRDRHRGIRTHPDSIGSLIQPGNQVVRVTPSGRVQRRFTELVYGYFWMLKDLERCHEKPVLANEKLISEATARVFPTLLGLKSLSGSKINVPLDFLRQNRSQDPAAQCTLVAVSFRDFGYQQLPSWIEPFDAAFADQDRVEVVKINISEGWFNKWILRGFILGSTKVNTPKVDHDRTFLYFSNTRALESLRDALRMHNVLAGYVFLLDGLGRVRFAGSGSATEEETTRLVRLARELTPLTSGKSPFAARANKWRSNSRGKKRT